MLSRKDHGTRAAGSGFVGRGQLWYNDLMSKKTSPSFSPSTATLMVAGVSLFVGTLILPGSDLSAVFGPKADEGFSLEALQAHRTDWREQRRLYSRAIETCRDRRQDGQVVDCTAIKINNPSTFRPFLVEAVASIPSIAGAVHTAAPALTVEMLSEHDRSQLRRYDRAGSCPASLKEYLPGFYELCLRVMEETQSPLGRGRMETAKKRVAPLPLPPRLTADDIAKAKKRPVPTYRGRVTRHQESRFSSSAASSAAPAQE